MPAGIVCAYSWYFFHKVTIFFFLGQGKWNLFIHLFVECNCAR